MNAEYFKTLFNYDRALFRRMWDSIMQLTDEQFVVNIDYSHGSIRNQMVHVTAVEERWLRGLQGLPDARGFNLDPANYPKREEVYRLWEDSEARLAAYVNELDVDELQRVPPGMPGPVWQVLGHMANHGTDHRAQVLRLLHDFGAPTFDQDLILYLWSR